MPGIHVAAGNVVQLLSALAERDGWSTTTELGDACDIHRDTARKILAELATWAWVLHDDSAGQDRWRLGTALPELAVAYQARLVLRARALAAEAAEISRGVDLAQAAVRL